MLLPQQRELPAADDADVVVAVSAVQIQLVSLPFPYPYGPLHFGMRETGRRKRIVADPERRPARESARGWAEAWRSFGRNLSSCGSQK